MRRALTLAGSLALAACGFQAPAPKITPPAETPPPALSTLDAELRLPASDIAKFLNEQTQAQVARLDDKELRCPFGKCRLDLIATRNGPITVKALGDRLNLSLPFNIDAKLKLKAPFLQTTGTAQGTGRVTAASTFAVAPDWELRSHTTGTIDISHADIRLGPITAELSGLLGNQSELIARPIFKELDKQIPKWIALPKQIAKVWAKANAPVQIGENPRAWLVLAPQHVFVAPPRVENDTLVLAMGVVTQARVLLGGKPDDGRLPHLLAPEPMRAQPQSRFHLRVDAVLPYGEAIGLAERQLEAHPVVIAGSTRVKVSELQIIPSHDDVVVAARLCLDQSWNLFGWFDACGHGYLRGTPEFEGDTGMLRITHISYDVGTINLLVGAWQKLTGDDFMRALEQRLVFDLSPQIAELKNQLGAAVARGAQGDISVSGRMESFGAPKLSWSKDGFIAAFTAEGSIKTKLRLRP